MAKSVKKQYAIGVDYGTNSVRALVVDVQDGREIATSVFDYPSGEAGILLDRGDPNLARQDPADYIEGFYQSVRGAVRAAGKQRGFQAENVVGIGIDTTGSTPIPVDRDGMPLALKPAMKKDLAAHAWLWKDHTSYAEAAEITQRAAGSSDGYLAKCGGSYSSEWYWSKILHCKRVSPRVFAAAYSWVELADFIPGFITGNLDPDTMPRSICAAGHKAMYHEQWGGLPDQAVSQERRSGAGGVARPLRRDRTMLRSKGRRTDGRGCQEGWTCRRASPWLWELSTPTWAR